MAQSDRSSPIPAPPGTTDGAFLGVAASATNDAWAVGFYTTAANVTKTPIEHYC
jgi:hypothetical protein